MKTKYVISFAVAVLGITLSLPVQADPPPWAPAHGHRAKQMREYRYVYYPAQQVYYAPEQRSWFWMNSSGDWNFGVNLPARYQVNATSGGVSVVLGSNRPYTEHIYVEEHYGRPWREKHKHKNGKHRDRHD